MGNLLDIGIKEIIMKICGKEIRDECKNCGDVLECELCRQGHGIGRERSNVMEMLKCQFSHAEMKEKSND